MWHVLWYEFVVIKGIVTVNQTQCKMECACYIPLQPHEHLPCSPFPALELYGRGQIKCTLFASNCQVCRLQHPTRWPSNGHLLGPLRSVQASTSVYAFACKILVLKTRVGASMTEGPVHPLLGILSTIFPHIFPFKCCMHLQAGRQQSTKPR